VQAAQQVYVMTNPGEVIFAKWEDEIFSLSPFMHYLHDTTGHETYLSVYKGKRESKFWYEPVKVRNNICYDPLQVRFDAEKVELQNLIVP
jgi:CRISPR/Cas system CMR-associated protein Cmr1 (group 7 of RAMP superfamily)